MHRVHAPLWARFCAKLHISIKKHTFINTDVYWNADITMSNNIWLVHKIISQFITWTKAS